MAKKANARAEAAYAWWRERKLRGDEAPYVEVGLEFGVTERTVRRWSKEDSWVTRLEEASHRINQKAAEISDLDHAQGRANCRQIADHYQGLLDTAVPKLDGLNERAMDRLAEAEKGDDLDLDSFVTLVTKLNRTVSSMSKELRELIVVGHGLPREHVVHHDEVHEVVRANRQSIKQAGKHVTELAAWKEARRARPNLSAVQFLQEAEDFEA